MRGLQFYHKQAHQLLSAQIKFFFLKQEQKRLLAWSNGSAIISTKDVTLSIHKLLDTISWEEVIDWKKSTSGTEKQFTEVTVVGRFIDWLILKPSANFESHCKMWLNHPSFPERESEPVWQREE